MDRGQFEVGAVQIPIRSTPLGANEAAEIGAMNDLSSVYRG